MNPWERFVTVARGGQADRIPVAMIVDSPWLPGYAGIDTLDYFLHQDQWLKINLDLLERCCEFAKCVALRHRHSAKSHQIILLRVIGRMN